MPRVRRLRRAQVRDEGARGRRRRAGEHRVRLGHRLLVAIPVLPRDLRLPHDPRPRARDCDGAEAGQSRARRLGRHRRRRRLVDRRQSSLARVAAQRGLQDSAVQQRDLRPDERPILADLAAGHALAVDSGRFVRLADLSGGVCDRCRREVHRACDRRRQSRLGLGARGRPRLRGRGVRRNLPELHRLQRRRVQFVHGPRQGRRRAAARRARQAARVRRGRFEGPRLRCEDDDAEGRRCEGECRATSSCTTRRIARSRSCCSRCRSRSFPWRSAWCCVSPASPSRRRTTRPSPRS